MPMPELLRRLNQRYRMFKVDYAADGVGVRGKSLGLLAEPSFIDACKCPCRPLTNRSGIQRHADFANGGRGANAGLFCRHAFGVGVPA